MGMEQLPVAPGPVLEKLRYADDGGGTCSRRLRNLTVASSLREEPGYLETLAPCLELGEGGNIPKEVCEVVLRSIGKECAAERSKPWLLSVTLFDEAAFHAHEGMPSPLKFQCINTLGLEANRRGLPAASPYRVLLNNGTVIV